MARTLFRRVVVRHPRDAALREIARTKIKLGRDIAAGLKNMVGGELKGYTELLTESRREAMSRMIAQAEALGANAVVNVRFSTSAITSGASEMMAYGTAVVAE